MKGGRDVLELLLRERSPEERQRLAEAWERVAGGDPESLPVLYALADRFSLEAHAALLGEIRMIHASLEGMAREIGQGATATVERTESAAKATSAHAALFAELIPKLERIAIDQEQAATKAVKDVGSAAGDIERSLRAARQHYDRSETWKNVVGLALLTTLLTATGFLLGGKLYEWREVDRLRGLIHRWDSGDKGANEELSRELRSYRERHGLAKPKQQ